MNKIYSFSWLLLSSSTISRWGFSFRLRLFSCSWIATFGVLSVFFSSNFSSGFITSVDGTNLSGGIGKLLLS